MNDINEAFYDIEKCTAVENTVIRSEILAYSGFVSFRPVAVKYATKSETRRAYRKFIETLMKHDMCNTQGLSIDEIMDLHLPDFSVTPLAYLDIDPSACVGGQVMFTFHPDD